MSQFKVLGRAGKLLCTTSLVFMGAAEMARADIFDEIVVTAQKREQSLQDVGISITAITSEEINKLNLKDIGSMANIIPNVTALVGAVGNPSFRIRGVGLNEFSSAFDSPVGVHVDEIFLWKPSLGSLGFFDIERVEALKGPQGTVFGRNTTAGAVNIYSKRPTDDFEAGVSASYGRYQRFDSEGYVSGPLSDNLKGRLAGQWKNYADDEGPYKNLFNGERIGELDQYQLRGMLEWSNDATIVLATIDYGDKEGDLVPYDNLFQDVPGGPPNPTKVITDPIGRFTVNQDHWPTTDTQTWGMSLRIEHETGIGTITSLTAYRDFERENTEDSDNTPVRSINFNWNSKIESFSQELRLGGEYGRWNYLLGAYYEDDSLEVVETADARDLLAIYIGDDYGVDTQSWAVFTNNEFKLTDRLSLILGARYTEETVEILGESFAAGPATVIGDFDRIAPADRFAIIAADAERTDNDFNVKAGLNFNITDDVLLFGSYSTGFRSGGYDLTFGGATFGSPLVTFDPESVTAYELGWKSTLLDGSMTFNTSIFYSEIEDYQNNFNLSGELVPRRRNAGTLEIKGFESDIQWQLNDNLMTKIGVGYTDAEITKSTQFVDGVPLQGKTPVNTPEWAANALVNYNFPISNGMAIDAILSAQWQDERYLEASNGADHLVSSYYTVDARLSLLSEDDSWGISLWGKNITDEKYLSYINDVQSFAFFLAINAEPATYGVSFDYKF